MGDWASCLHHTVRARGCFDTNLEHYLILDGGVSGSILSTSNGTRRTDHDANVLGIDALGCTGCTIQNLTIADMYVYVGPSDVVPAEGDGDTGIMYSGSAIAIRNNTLDDDAWAIVAVEGERDHNVVISGNDIYNVDHGIALTSNHATGSDIDRLS